MSNNILNLNELNKDIELTFSQQTYHMPPVTNSYANKVTNLVQQVGSKNTENLKEEDINNIVLEFLNSNREGFIFNDDFLTNDLSLVQRRALFNFIIEYVFDIEKK